MKSNTAKVFVQGGPADSYGDSTRSVFDEHGYQIVLEIDRADVVVWTGGADINPNIYGQKNLFSSYNSKRDVSDLDAVRLAGDKFKVGICRGAQLLNCVPNNGTLWQDCDHHVGNHPVRDILTGEEFQINSYHHQQVRLTHDAELLAYSIRSTYKKAADKFGKVEMWRPPELNGALDPIDVDVEAAYYPKTRSLLFQAHPEFGNPRTTQYFFELMDRKYWGME